MSGSSRPPSVAVGVVCVAGSAARTARYNPCSYLVAHRGRQAWASPQGERTLTEPAADGELIAVSEGWSQAHDSYERAVAAEAAVRVMAKLHASHGRPYRLDEALAAFTAKAHTRMHWKQRADRRPAIGASLAVAWRRDDEVAWLALGRTRLALFRGGQLQRLDTRVADVEQRFIYGSRGGVDDTALVLEQGVNVGLFGWQSGDRLVAGTGALWQGGEDAQFAALLADRDTPQDAAVALRERAMVRSAAGAMSVVVLG